MGKTDSKDEIKEAVEKAGKKEKKPVKKEDPKDSQIRDLTETAQHVQADFENFRKRKEKEQEEYTKFACSQVIGQIIPIIDNFELALQHTENKDEFVKGVELIYSEFIQMLENNGVDPINPQKGEDFNAYEHEALLAEKSKEKENSILEVMQKGYKIGDRVIRHAKVKVAKK